MFCPYCGERLSEGDNFCTRCGKRLPQRVPPAVPAAQAQPAAEQQREPCSKGYNTQAAHLN